MSYIYIIRHLETGEFYLGSARDVEFRWKQHRDDLQNNRHVNPRLQSYWNKYGPDAFEFLILEDNIPTRHQFDVEQWWLDYLGCHFNLNPFASHPTRLGMPHLESTKQKIRERKLGQHHSDQTRERLSRLALARPRQKGYRHTEEARQKMRDSHRGKSRPPRPDEVRKKISAGLLGHVVTEETRRKQSESHRGSRRPHSEEAKRKMSERALERHRLRRQSEIHDE
jgi:group I intron endonuclease